MQNHKTKNFEGISEDLYNQIEKLQEGQYARGAFFSDVSKIPAGTVTFRVGEEIELKGSLFRVHRIKKKDIVLRRVKKKER